MTKCGASATPHKDIVKSKIVQQNEMRKDEAPAKSWMADNLLLVKNSNHVCKFFMFLQQHNKIIVR